MEFLFLSLIFIGALCYIFHTKNGSTKNCHLPPGNNGWPLFGEMIEYLSLAKKGYPEKFMQDRIKKYSSKIFKTSLFFEPMVMFCSAEGNKFLFSNENKHVQFWLPSSYLKIIPFLDKLNDSEMRIRWSKVMLPILKPDALQKHVAPMDEIIKHHMKTHWNFDEIKVHPIAHKCSFLLSCRLFLNIDDLEIINRLEKRMNLIQSGIISLPINLPRTKFNQAIKASQEIRKEIEGIVRKRKIELLEKKVLPTHDIMSQLILVTYDDGEYFNEIDIANGIFGMLVASYDSISITIVSIVKYLTQLPQVYEEVLKEQMEITNSNSKEKGLIWEDTRKMKYLRNVISEALRLMPPSSGTFREAITDFTYQGFHIPKGYKIHWNAYTTHKNPEYFPNPEKFDPTRFEDPLIPYSYVPFGGGPRMCSGAEYARLVVLVFIHNLVKQFKWEMVFPDEKIILDPLLMPVHGLPIRLYPRHT